MNRNRPALIALTALLVAAGGWFFLFRSSGASYQGKPVSYWFKQYYQSDDKPDQKKEAIAALQKMGTNALPYLVGMAFTREHDTAFRTNLYDLLSDLPEYFHAPKFVSWKEIRSHGTSAIGAITPLARAVLPLIKSKLDTTNSPEHEEAFMILCASRGGAGIRVPYLAKALQEKGFFLQMSALDALSELGVEAKDAVPDLVIFFQDTSNADFLRLQAASLLARMGSNAAPAIPMLTDCFNREDNSLDRFSLAADLCQIDAGQTAMLLFLIHAVTNSANVSEMGRAAMHLGFVGPNAKPAIPALFQALSTSNLAAWKSIDGALKNLGISDDQLVPKLREKLTLADDEFKVYAALQILLSDPADEEAQRGLTEQIKKHSRYEAVAVRGLGRAGPPARGVVAEIMEALNGPNVSSWIAVPAALHEIGAAPESVLPKLDAKLQSHGAWKDNGSPLEFAGQILRLEPKDRAAQLFMIELIKSDAVDAPYAIGWLSELRSPPADVVAALKQALKARHTQRSAAEALDKLSSPSAAKN